MSEPFECWHQKARVKGDTVGTLRLHCPTCGLAVGVNPKWVGVVGSGPLPTREGGVG